MVSHSTAMILVVDDVDDRKAHRETWIGAGHLQAFSDRGGGGLHPSVIEERGVLLGMVTMSSFWFLVSSPVDVEETSSS